MKSFEEVFLSIILGIDPGSYVTGFGLLKAHRDHVEHVSHGVILLPKDQALPERLRVLAEGMSELLEKYKPSAVAIEKIFLGKNADSAFKLGHARGVVMSFAASSGAQVYEYATRVVKKGIAGKGSADKLQVRDMVQRYLRLSVIERMDASDALALALYHAQVSATDQKLQRGLSPKKPIKHSEGVSL